MKYAGIIKNDFAAAPGVSTTFFVQGCSHHCPGCHNPQTWDFNGGKEFSQNTINEIIEALTANGVKRSLAIQGGEPLHPDNQFLTLLVIRNIKEQLPDTEVYIWTGYYFDDIPETPYLSQILNMTKCIIDGPYIEAERDITLPMRGSSNQNIIYLDNHK